MQTVPTLAGRGMSTEAPPGPVTDSQLAVLLRQAQWALDEAAVAFGQAITGQRPPPTGQQREALASALETLAATVRASGTGDAP